MSRRTRDFGDLAETYAGLAGLPDRSSEHFTRLWPVRPGQTHDAPLFLALVLPARLAALALLWVTAAPGRLVVLLAALVALIVAVLV
jgi:hypothetical protein